MKRCLILVISILALCPLTKAQLTLTLQPGSAQGKDCEVFSLQPSTNFVSDLLRGNSWTFTGNPGIERGFIQFDLTPIPREAIVDSAFLYLYSPTPPNSQNHSGDNAAYIKRVIEPWNETTLTWNNQPLVVNSYMVSLPASTDAHQDYTHIDVTLLVRDMASNPENSFGFMLMQKTEKPFRRMSFCSSDYPDPAKHPKLVVHYSPQECTSIVLQPGSEGKDCEIYSLQPSTNFVSDMLRGNSWTWSGDEGIERGLFEFDLSVLPQNAKIAWARLSLFSLDEPTTQFHSGDNAGVLQRITSPWQENTVTWNNQPVTTTANQVALPASTFAYQDYLNVDVTSLIKDMVDDPGNSHGFMLSLQNENIYRRLAFCSGDYPNPQKHPRLEICYTEVTSVDHPAAAPVFGVFPNPAFDVLYVKLNDAEYLPGSGFQLEIVDAAGRRVFQGRMDQASSTIPVASLSAGAYTVRLLDANYHMVSSAQFVKVQR